MGIRTVIICFNPKRVRWRSILSPFFILDADAVSADGAYVLGPAPFRQCVALMALNTAFGVPRRSRGPISPLDF